MTRTGMAVLLGAWCCCAAQRTDAQMFPNQHLTKAFGSYLRKLLADSRAAFSTGCEESSGLTVVLVVPVGERKGLVAEFDTRGIYNLVNIEVGGKGLICRDIEAGGIWTHKRMALLVIKLGTREFRLTPSEELLKLMSTTFPDKCGETLPE